MYATLLYNVSLGRPRPLRGSSPGAHVRSMSVLYRLAYVENGCGPPVIHRLPSTVNQQPSTIVGHAGEFERVKRIAFVSSCV